MLPQPGPLDEQLALRTSQGDRDAFAELYNRHFRSVYDLIYRMVRDEEVAADTAQNTFIRAWESLQKRKVSGNVRAWLLTIARNTAINEIKRRKRWRAIAAEPVGDEAAVLEAVDTSRLSNPEAVVDDKELVDLVWTSAAALGPKDYSLLDMHLRKDLSASEMAEGLGLTAARVHVMLSRLKDSLEESVTLALLARRGRRDCPELSEILGRRETALSRDLRLEVRHHLKQCALCTASRKRFVAPAEIFSGLALIPVSDEMIAASWLKLSPLLVAGGASAGLLAAAADRIGGWWAGSSIAGKAAGVAVVGAVIAVPIGASLMMMSGGDAGADDPDSDGSNSSAPRVASSSTKTTEAQASESDNESTNVSPTPLVAGAVASPAPENGAPGSSPPPAAPPGAETPAPPPGQTAAPPAPSAAPPATQTPGAQPTPTPAPPPPNQADIVVAGVTLAVNGQPPAGQQFLLSATALLRNLGGATSALVDTTFTLTAPAGCVFTGATPVTVQNKTLPLGSDVSITRTWSVTCAAAGDYSFGVGASAAIDPSQALSDPNPGNNANAGGLVVSVLP